jgi:hypothetical protein
MHRKICSFGSILLFACSASAQTQTPRQALIEMFSARDSKSFERHLPKIMQSRLAAIDIGTRDRFSPSSGLPVMGRNDDVRWFETGSLLVMRQDANSRLEVHIAKENLQGDRDDLELSFSGTMNGETHEGGDSRVLLTMQNEDGIWRLSEVGLTFKMKLDGSLIESFAKQMKAVGGGPKMSTLTTPTETPSRRMSAGSLSIRESAAVDALRQLLAAQTQYRGANPDVGYSCDSTSLSVNDVSGYRTMIVGCKGTPVTNFKVTLTPIGVGSRGQRAFCADESGQVRYSDDGKGISCLSEKNWIE